MHISLQRGTKIYIFLNLSCSQFEKFQFVCRWEVQPQQKMGSCYKITFLLCFIFIILPLLLFLFFIFFSPHSNRIFDETRIAKLSNKFFCMPAYTVIPPPDKKMQKIKKRLFFFSHSWNSRKKLERSQTLCYFWPSPEANWFHIKSVFICIMLPLEKKTFVTWKLSVLLVTWTKGTSVYVLRIKVFIIVMSFSLPLWP